MNAVCIALFAAWQLPTAAAEATMEWEQRDWIPPEYNSYCFDDKDRYAELPFYNKPYIYLTKHTFELPAGVNDTPASYVTHCSPPIRETDMIRAPIYCPRERHGCQSIRSEIRRVHKAHGKKGAEFKIELSNSPNNLCHCTLAYLTTEGTFRVKVEPSPRWKKESAERDGQDMVFDAFVPREQALAIPRNLVDFTLNEGNTTYFELPNTCRYERDFLRSYPQLLRTHKNLVAFSVNPSMGKYLCPTSRVRQTMLHISPSKCNSNRGLAYCPRLGTVSLVLPAPWNSLFVRDLGSTKLSSAAFYVLLPQHVTQHLVPEAEYTVTQNMIDPDYIQSEFKIKEDTMSIKYPNDDSCFIQLDLMARNHKSSTNEYCTPYIELSSRSSPFNSKSFRFRVRAAAFCINIILQFRDKEYTVSVSFIENQIVYKLLDSTESKRQLVRILAQDPLQTEYYSTILKEKDLMFLWFDEPLFVLNTGSDFGITGAANRIVAVEFGYPGVCKACPTSDGIVSAIGETYRVATVQLIKEQCAPGRCVHYRSGGNYRRPSKESKDKKPPWLVHLHPSWSFVHTISIYNYKAELTFSESADLPQSSDRRHLKTTDIQDPNGLSITVNEDTITARLGSATIPLKMEKKYHSKKIKDIFNSHAYGFSPSILGILTPKPEDLGPDAVIHTAVTSISAGKAVNTLYVAWNMFTFELGLADLRSPYVQMFSETDWAALRSEKINFESLQRWNHLTSPLASGALPRPALPRYVLQVPCVLEDHDGKGNSSSPACLYDTPMDNNRIESCLDRVEREGCGAAVRPLMHSPHRAAHPACLYDPDCHLAHLLDTKTEMDSIMSSALDFAVNGETSFIIPVSDVVGALDSNPIINAICIEISPHQISVKLIKNKFSMVVPDLRVPMAKGFLKESTFRGFRLKSEVSQSQTIVQLYDLSQMRPDEPEQELWSHSFDYRIIFSHVYFFAQGDNQYENDTHVLINCVPEYDKCVGRNPCYNKGDCKFDKCVCKPGYQGEYCENSPCDRHAKRCLNGASCVEENVEPYFACLCTNEWRGKWCEVMVDHCDSLPCADGATCLSEVGNFSCQCPKYFKGRFCRIATDVCSRRRPCKNGATCHIKEDGTEHGESYYCECPERYIGTHCQISQAYNVALFHTGIGRSLSSFPFKLVAQALGAQPFRCFIDLQDNTFTSVESEDFHVSQMNRRQLWAQQGFDVSHYDYRGGFLLDEFTHMYTHPGSYNITVKCTNQGYNTPVHVTPVRITPNPNPDFCIPSVEIRNSGLSREEAPAYYPRDTLRLYAVTKSDCPTVKISQVRWSLHPITEQTPYPAEGSELPVPHELSEHDLRIPAFTFSYGMWAAKMKADAYIKELGTVSSFGLGWFQIRPHPLQCVLTGGDKVTMPVDDVSLDGGRSHDPDNADGRLGNVTAQWRCWRHPSEQADHFCLGKQQPLIYTGLELHVPASELEVERQYMFELTLRHAATSRGCTTQQLVDVAAAGTSRAGIVCVYNCQDGADWQDKISFRADCSNCPGDYTVLWRIKSSEGGSLINWGKDTSFGANSKYLIINARALKPGGKYKISVYVAQEGEGILDSGLAQMTTLRLRSAPTNGSCNADPPEGMSGVTSFQLRCDDWEGEALPLNYMFMQKNQLNEFTVLYADINPLAKNVTLAPGNPEHSFSTTVKVRIADANEMWSYTSFNITVRPPVEISEDSVIEATKKVFTLLPSGLDKIQEAIQNGDIPQALQVVDASASLLNRISDPEAEEVTEMFTKRRLRKKILDSMDKIKPTTLATLQQTAGALTSIANGHRDEYYPATVEKLINSTEKLSETLRDDYGKDDSVSPKQLEKASQSILGALSTTLSASTEEMEPPSLKPVDLIYPNNERDYDVFDEERNDHIEEKRKRVAHVVAKYMNTANNMYEAIGRTMESGERPRQLKSKNIDMWIQKLNNETVTNSTVAGLPPNRQIQHTDGNYVLIPDIGSIINSQLDDVKSVELTVTSMKKNPYWWDQDSAKNVTTSVVNVNLRGIPGYKPINVDGMKKKLDIFLRRSKDDVKRETGKVLMLDWYQTLKKRSNSPRDTDIINHKIILPPGGYSQIIQLIPIPQIALAKDREDGNITYEVPVKLFLTYRIAEKAGIHNMKHSFMNSRVRKIWSVPHNLKKMQGRPVDVFTVIHKPPPLSGDEIEEWYLGAMLHPETGKRLINESVLVPIEGHKNRGKNRKHRETSLRRPEMFNRRREQQYQMRLAMGRSVMQAQELYNRIFEDPNDTPLHEDDGVFSSRSGGLKSDRAKQQSKTKLLPSNISSIYEDQVIASLSKKVICGPTMTFHACERHQSIKYNLTMFAARCIYWDDKQLQFTDKGCEVGELSTVDVLHCRCNHLTAFAGSFLVLPNKIDRLHPINTAMLLQMNSISIFVMLALLTIYIMLFMYARKQDLRDVKRRQIIYVDDNDPRHQYAYLVTVYTGVQYKSGTTARVAMVIVGDRGESDTHLLTGEKKRKRTLERGSDSWFLITTAESLGDLQQLRIWHDNSGKNPEWFLDRVLVRDCQTDRVWIFLVCRWVHPVTGLLVTTRPAALHEVVAWNTSVARRAEESLRDGHLWLSIFSRPLNSPFTRCQRLISATTLLTANIVTSLAFYGIPSENLNEEQISRSGTFGIEMVDIIISIESAIIVTLLVAPIVIMFRQSRPLENVTKRTVVVEIAEDMKGSTRTEISEDTVEGNGEQENSSQAEKLRDADHKDTKIQISKNTANDVNQDADEATSKTGNTDDPTHQEVTSRRISVTQFTDKLENTSSSAALNDIQEGWKLPWWFIYIAWLLSSVTIGISVMLSIRWSMSFGEVKCYIWLASSGISLLQSIIIIQPLLIVGISLLCAYICGATPEVENRSFERPQNKDVDEHLVKQYAETIQAKRTLPMYHQIPAKKLRKLHADKMKALLTREAIKDIATFLVYILCLLFIIHSSKDSMAYYSTLSAKNMFIGGNMVKECGEECTQFSEATDMGSVYKYLNTTFLQTLHHVVDYNDNPDRHDGMTTQASLFFIGVVRLRQVRVTRDPCHTPDRLFWMNFTACKKEFAWHHEDTADYGQNWSPDPTYHTDAWTNEATEAWLYKNSTYLRALPFAGEFATYPGSGYTLHFGRNIKSSKVVLKYVSDSTWFDAYTRGLFIEFTLYNADSDLFNQVILLFEQTGVGTVTPTYTIRTSKLLVRSDTMGKIDVYIMIFYVGFIVFNTVVESRRIRKLGPRKFFADRWNVLDALMVVMGYICIGLYVYRIIVVNDAIQNLRNTDGNKFANFYIPVFWDYTLTYVQAFTLLITMAKFWKILTFNKRMVTFSLTLRHSQRDLRAFFVVFLVAVLAYAFWAHIMFGTGVSEFSDMWSAMMALILFSIGTFDASTYTSADRALGTLFFVTYVFFIMIFLINVMLSIIMAGYEMAKDDMEELETKYDVIDVFIWEIRNFFEDSSSESDENAVITARTRRRRKVRSFLRKAMPCCVPDTRQRDLLRSVEQEEMRQLQRFMSRTAASGRVPHSITQDEGSIGSEEDVIAKDQADRGRRKGFAEPEDEYDDEFVTVQQGPDEAELAPHDVTGVADSAQRFLLDREDVDTTGRQFQRKKAAPRHHRHHAAVRAKLADNPALNHGGRQKGRFPAIPNRKSAQRDPHFLASLTVVPEDMTRQQQRNTQVHRRPAALRTRDKAEHRQYGDTHGIAGNGSTRTYRLPLSMRPQHGHRVSFAEQPNDSLPADERPATSVPDPYDGVASSRKDPFRSRVHVINETLRYVEADVETHATQL